MKILMRLLAATFMVMSIGLTSALAQTGDTTQFRFVHAIPGVAAIDIYVDGQLSVHNLDFGEASGYINVPLGSRQLTVRPTGLTTNLWQQPAEAVVDSPTTYIASTINPLGFVPFVDDFTAVALGTTRFKAIHVISGGPTVDVFAGEDSIGSVDYGAFVGTFDVPADTYEITVVPTGGSTDDALIPEAPFDLASNSSNMLIVYGTPSLPDVMLLTAPLTPEAASGSVRFAHSVAGAPDVDIYLNDIKVVPGLAFSEATDHLAIAAADYALKITLVDDPDTVILESDLTAISGATATVLALGEEGDVSVSILPDDVDGVTESAALVSVVNAITGDSEVTASLADGTVLAENLAFGESGDVVSIDPTAQAVKFTLSINGQSATLDLGVQDFYGGVYYNVIAVDGTTFSPPTLVFEPTVLAAGIASAPGAEGMAIVSNDISQPVEPTAVEDTSSEVVVAQPTEAPAPPVVATEPPPPTAIPATPAPEVPTARILLDPDANLQLRECIGSQARSLGLAPSSLGRPDVQPLEVVGREGESEVIEGLQCLYPDEPPVDPDAEYVDPASLLVDEDDDLVPEETWLYVKYSPPAGGEVRAWVNALYLEVRDPDGELMRLADLPQFPRNRTGQVIDSDMTPPPVPEESVTVRIINLNQGVPLKIRRTPVSTGEIIGDIFSGSAAEFVALGESGDWVFIRYLPAEGGTIEGWVSTQYVEYEYRNAPIDLEEMELRNLLETAPEAEFCDGTVLCGSRSANAPAAGAQATASVRDTRDVFIAEVALDPGANLILRGCPDRNSTNVTLQSLGIDGIPSGTPVIVEGRDVDAEWLYIQDFEGIQGWVNTQFVFVTYNEEIIRDITPIPIIDLLTEPGIREECLFGLPTATPTGS
jgi:uncharacterized protein YraI